MYIFILSFTTSHVTVYLCYIALAPLSQLHFNTSHVTVYRELKSSYFTSLIISIHLMLLFIMSSDILLISYAAFQYISCYCLSIAILKLIWSLYYFNTSHVTVYLYISSATAHTAFISIHLMLLFIPFTHQTSFWLLLFQYISCYCLSLHCKDGTCYLCNFNTSHVTVYRMECFIFR